MSTPLKSLRPVLADGAIHFFKDVSARVGERVNFLIEIPKGGTQKYEYKYQTDRLELDRSLPAQYPYPVNYGIIPQAINIDCDPLDILLLGDAVATGATGEAEILGLFLYRDGVGRERGPKFNDHKVIARPKGSKLALTGALKQEIFKHFNVYKSYPRAVQEGKWSESQGFSGREDAEKYIEECVLRWKNRGSR